MQKLLTVIVPIYNVSAYLNLCIDSIINQTYKNLEIILVDDGSTDKSSEICDKYTDIDTRIKVIHKKNGGLVSARKAGLQCAKGEYTAFVDGDDWIDSDMYEYLMGEMERNQADILATGFFKECGESASVLYDGVEEGCYDRTSGMLSKQLFFKAGISNIGVTSNMVTKLFRTDVVKEYYMKISDDISYGEDAACIYSSVPFVNRVQIIHKAFYHYRFREDSIVHTKNEKVLQQIGLLYEHLISCFRSHEEYRILRKQLSAFITLNVFRGLNYFMDIDDEVKIPLYVVPHNVYNYGKRIVLYGAGMVGQAYERQLELSDESELVLWVDKMASHYKAQGKKVDEVSEILHHEFDVILLAVSDEDMVSEIRKSLIEMGINKKKIYWELPKSIIDQFVHL